VLITKVKAAAAADTTAVNSDILDMSGWDGVVFLASVGTANAGNYMKAQQDTDSAGGTMADLEGTKVGVSKTDMVLDLYRPTERYVRAVITRGASATVEAIWAIQYKGRKGAQLANNVTTAQAAEVHASPAEGTA
jgi:hypothetical protein